MSPNELAKHILRMYETNELEDAIAEAIRTATVQTYEECATAVERSNVYGASFLAAVIRNRKQDFESRNW